MERLDVEYLQKLTYDRSKTWSSFILSYENQQTIARLEDIEEDVDITKIEKVFFTPSDDDDFSDDLASMEDDCEDNVKAEFLKAASNTSQFSLLIGNTSVDLSTMANNDEEKQYADVINKTLPILNEHNRQLQKFGFDKVLISFNKDEIEDKYGSWLNRHNSLFGGDSTLIYDDKHKNSTGKELATYLKHTRGKSGRINSREVDSDSDASLQSGETARYIRSSKVGTVKNSTTTMIKTYRMVRTREALREKYAYETDEDDCYHNALRVRKKRGNMEYENYYMTPFGRSIKSGRDAATTRTQRRKVLRKRLNINSCNISYSSSDSECYESYRKSESKNLKFCGHKSHHCATNYDYYKSPLTPAKRNGKILKPYSPAKMSSALRNRLYYFSRSISLSSSSSSMNSIPEKRRYTKRDVKFCNDGRPSKRESECYCYNDKELCKQFKHVADTSTDEWHVDSGCISKQQFITPVTRSEAIKAQELKSCQSEVPQPVAVKRRNNVENENSLKKNKTKSKNEQTQKSLTVQSCDSELKKAIKASLQTYDKERKSRHKELNTEKDDNIKPTKPTRRPLKIGEENVAKKSAITTRTRRSQRTSSVTKKSKIPQDFSSPLKKSSEDTFFTSTQNKAICNSTALSFGDQAYKRQMAANQIKVVEDEDTNETSKDITVIELNQRRPKAKYTRKKLTSSKENRPVENNGVVNSAVSSTTLRSPELNWSLTLPQIDESKRQEQIEEQTGGDQSDCTHVTSTTTIEVPANETITKKTEQTPEQQRTLDPYAHLTRNCVLIYAPENQNTASATDGYFTVTEEHLSTLLGEKATKKFLKYYTGHRRFRHDLKVYYKPPNNTFLCQNLSSSSESNDDLDGIYQYGDLFAIRTNQF